MNTEFAIFIVTTLVLVFIFYAIIRHWNKKEFKYPEIIAEFEDSPPRNAHLNANPYYENPKNQLRYTPRVTNHSVKYEEPPRNEYTIPVPLFIEDQPIFKSPNPSYSPVEAPEDGASNYYDSCSSDSSSSDSSSSCSSGGGD